MGKQRSGGEKAFVLTIPSDIHICPLVDDPLSVFPAHLKSTEEWKDAVIIAKKHRQQALPYSNSCCLINTEEFGLVLLSRAYYNSIRNVSTE